MTQLLATGFWLLAVIIGVAVAFGLFAAFCLCRAASVSDREAQR